MSGSHIGRGDAGLTDAVARPDMQSNEDWRRSVAFYSLTGVAITRLWNGDWFYMVGTSGGTVTLPAVADEIGHTHIIKHASDISATGATKIVPADSSLDGSATHSMAGANAVRAYFSSGDAWRSVGPIGGATGDLNGGTFETSVSLGANVTFSGSPRMQWLKVGPTVNVSGGLNVKATAAAGTQSEVELTIPIPSNLGATPDLAGHVNAQGANEAGIAYADTASDRARLRWLSQTSATHTMWFNFTYRIA